MNKLDEMRKEIILLEVKKEGIEELMEDNKEVLTFMKMKEIVFGLEVEIKSLKDKLEGELD